MFSLFHYYILFGFFFFFSSRRRHTRWTGDWSSRRVLFRSLAAGRACLDRRRHELVSFRLALAGSWCRVAGKPRVSSPLSARIRTADAESASASLTMSPTARIRVADDWPAVTVTTTSDAQVVR